MTRYYYETSFVNYLYDKYHLSDIIATRTLQTLKGNKLYISTVTLWEILLTKNETRRNGLVILCQHLFEPEILKSPTEICFDYINQKFPKRQNFFDGKSNMNIGKVWEQVSRFKGASIEYDFNEFNAVAKHVKTLSKDINKYIDHIIFDIELSTKYQVWNASITDIANHIYKIHPTENKELERIRKLSVLLTFYFLCVGTDIENTICEAFWKSKGVANEPMTRMMHLIENYPKFFFGGPIECVSNFIYFQNIYYKNKTNRGTIHDGLHAIYLPFINILLTDDIVFKEFKNVATLDMYKKIYHTSEIHLTERPMEIINNGS